MRPEETRILCVMFCAVVLSCVLSSCSSVKHMVIQQIDKYNKTVFKIGVVSVEDRSRRKKDGSEDEEEVSPSGKKLDEKTQLLLLLPFDEIAEVLKGKYGITVDTSEIKASEITSSFWKSKGYSVAGSFVNIAIFWVGYDDPVRYELVIRSGNKDLVVHSNTIVTDDKNDPVRMEIRKMVANSSMIKSSIFVDYIQRFSAKPGIAIPLFIEALKRDVDK